MNLHIFNPEHDIALAANLSNFTAPHAGRQLRHDLGFLPMLWAKGGDAVLVDDLPSAEKAWALFKKYHRYVDQNGAIMVDARQLKLLDLTAIEPWGWDLALRAYLLRKGVHEKLLCSEDKIKTIRELSHRRLASNLLSSLRVEGTIGESFECTTDTEVESLLQQYGQVIMKAPWSSSGRGLRFLSVDHTPLSMQLGWLHHLLDAQGSVMVEPYYKKVKDFGMEFSSDGVGGIAYLGLSLFHTSNGAYTGNIVASEEAKQLMLSRYLPEPLLCEVRDTICQQLGKAFKGRYAGPFGVDMMVVTDKTCQRFLLHPCVEINLRRTMGHVALALNDDNKRVMSVVYTNNNYKLKLKRV